MPDFFCLVSGGVYFHKRREFRDAVTEDWACVCGDDDNLNPEEVPGVNLTLREDESCNKNEGDAEDDAQRNNNECDDDIYNPEVSPSDYSLPKPPHKLSNIILNGLLYSQEDVDSSSNFVLLCPYKRHENGTAVFLDTFDCPRSEEIMESNIMEVFNVIPAVRADLGNFQNENYIFNLSYGSTCIIMYTAYLILKQASPRLKPHMIYQLAFHPKKLYDGLIDDIDYGPVAGIHGRHADWLGLSGIRNVDDQIKDWRLMLTQKGKTEEEILYDAWRGRGNMWVFVRPDRFPIAETLAASPLLVVSGHSSVGMNPHRSSAFDALPLDILILICQWLPVKYTHMVLCTNRGLRSQILPHANMIAYQQIITCERHLLPAGPFELRDRKHGREEVDWWDAEWSKGGICKEEFHVKIPWFLYCRECSKSLSIWNRWRIWDIAQQLERLAIDQGFLSAEQ
ncbi:hypothetical protein BYT27DRAFT_7161601 [Phlegmacium glaucopus]|nr:hypothetical protein BYT27DRAFT_7161601 [Phlegmacium glaucopus]